MPPQTEVMVASSNATPDRGDGGVNRITPVRTSPSLEMQPNQLAKVKAEVKVSNDRNSQQMHK